MPLSVCEPDAWYLVIACKACGARQPLHRDVSQGKSALLRNYKWRCIECQHVDIYDPNEIERYQHNIQPRQNPQTS